jgi:uncharacterized protein YjbI with pentapeptide repeats
MVSPVPGFVEREMANREHANLSKWDFSGAAPQEACETEAHFSNSHLPQGVESTVL